MMHRPAAVGSTSHAFHALNLLFDNILTIDSF